MATKLGISVAPSGTNRSGSPFQVQPKISIQDALGVIDNTSTATVTATISTGTGTFVGTSVVNAVSGVATFTNLGITGIGVFVVTFTSPGLTSVAPNWFVCVRTTTTLDPVVNPGQLSRPATTTTVTVNPSDTTDFQNKLNANAGGSGICFKISGTYGKITYPKFSGWCVIEDVNAPVYLGRTNIRIDTLTAATFATIVTNDSGPAIGTSLTPSAFVWLRQVHVTCTSGLTIQYGLVTLGTDGPGGQISVATTAHHFGVEQCWIHSPDVNTTSRIGIALNCGEITVIDSVVGPQHEVGIEAQSMATWNGIGPFYIDNNEMLSAGEVFIAGGSDSADATLLPGDLHFVNNYCHTISTWKTNGLGWSFKNIFELKNMKRAYVAGNIFEGMWRANQDGHGIAIKSVNQGNSAPWSGTTDVEFAFNICRNMGGWVDFGANPDNNNPCIKLQRVYFHDNQAYNINPVQSGLYNSDSPLLFLQQGGIADLRFEHNTGFSNSFPVMDLGDGGTAPKAIALGPGFDSGGGTYVAFDPTLGGTFKHNLLDAGLYCVAGDGNTGQTAWNTYMNSVVQQTNLFVRAGASGMDSGRQITSGTYIDSISTNSDGSIATGSPYKAWAADGKDPGADFTLLNPATVNTLNGGGSGNTGGGGGGGGGGGSPPPTVTNILSRQFRSASSDRGDLPNDFADWEYTQPWTAYFGGIRVNSNASGGILGKQEGSVNFRGWHVFHKAGTTNNTFAATVGNTGSIEAVVRTTTEFAINIFHKVAFRYSGSGTAAGFGIRVDGVNQALTTIDDTLAGNTIKNTVNAQLGCRGGVSAPAFFGNFYARRVALFTRSLTDQEVTDLDSGAKLPTDIPNFYAWWEFGTEDDGITAVRDRSLNKRAMAITGTVVSTTIDPSINQPPLLVQPSGFLAATYPVTRIPLRTVGGKTAAVLNNQGYLTNGATPTGTAGDQIGPGAFVKRNGKYFIVLEAETGAKTPLDASQSGAFDWDAPSICGKGIDLTNLDAGLVNQGLSTLALINCNNIGADASTKTAMIGETSSSDIFLFNSSWYMFIHTGGNSGTRRIRLLKYTGALDVDGFPSVAGGWAIQNSGTPIINVGAAASWNESGVADCYILRKIDGTPILDSQGRMIAFYAGWNSAGTYGVGIARSANATTWTVDAANPVLKGNLKTGSWWSTATYPDGFIYYKGKVIAYIGGAPNSLGTGCAGIGAWYADIDNLTVWTEGQYNPIYIPIGAASLEAIGSTTGYAAIDGNHIKLLQRYDNATAGATGYRGRGMAQIKIPNTLISSRRSLMHLR